MVSIRVLTFYDDNYSRSHKQKLANLERRAEEVIKPAIDWIKQQSSPWFLWIHCYDPHDPYEPPPPFSFQYADDPYNGEVAYVDYALKPLIDLTEADPYRNSTIVILRLTMVNPWVNMARKRMVFWLIIQLCGYL